MAESLKNSALSGAKWVTISNVGRYFISFGLSIILARLLAPEEFGLIGMLSIFTAIALVFINSGLSTAIIRTKDATPEDYSTVFYFNITVSIFFYLLLYFTAPLIANFYNEPRLVNLTRLISLVFVINSFGIIQKAILVKAINFKLQSICILSGLFISAIIASIMAFKGYGVYSIVGQAISQAIVTNILFWATSKWRPKEGFKKASFLKLWAFGSKILATNIIVKIVDNIDNILIGRIFSAGQLGFYVRAKSTKQLPEQIFSGSLSSTAFAVLSKVNDNEEELKRLHIKFYQLGSYVFLPIIFGFMAIAEAFTVVLYSDKWLPSVPLFQIIALASIAYFLGTLFSQTIMAKGDSKLYLKLNTSKKLIGLLAIPFAIIWGLYTFLIAFVILNFIGLLLDFIFTSSIIKTKISTYIIYLLKPLSISIIMAICVYSLTYTSINSYYLILLLQIALGFVVYILLSIVFKFEEYYYVKDIAIEQLKKFTNRFNRK